MKATIEKTRRTRYFKVLTLAGKRCGSMKRSITVKESKQITRALLLYWKIMQV
jgi:hypothetical protein